MVTYVTRPPTGRPAQWRVRRTRVIGPFHDPQDSLGEVAVPPDSLLYKLGEPEQS